MAEDDEGRLRLYQELIAFPTSESIDYPMVSERFDLTPQQLSGVTTGMKRGGVAWKFLIDHGIPDHLIPPWVKRPEGAKSPFAPQTEEPEEPEKPEKTTEKPRITRKTEKEEKDVGERYPSSYYDPSEYDEGEDEEVTKPPERKNVGNPRSPWGDSVIHNRSLKDFYANESVDQGVFRSPEGELLRKVVARDGKVAYLPVEEPTEELEDYTDFSQIAVNTIKVHTQAIMKKISMNPNVLSSFSYAVSKGWLHEDQDIGDFVNKCVDYSMQSLFGVKFGVIKVGDGAMDRFERARQYYSQPRSEEGYYVQ